MAGKLERLAKQLREAGFEEVSIQTLGLLDEDTIKFLEGYSEQAVAKDYFS